MCRCELRAVDCVPMHHGCVLWRPVQLFISIYYWAAPKTEAVTGMWQRRQWPSLNHVENFWLLFLRLTCLSSDRCVWGTSIDDAHHATWLCSNLNIALASIASHLFIHVLTSTDEYVLLAFSAIAFNIQHCVIAMQYMCNRLSRAADAFCWVRCVRNGSLISCFVNYFGYSFGFRHFGQFSEQKSYKWRWKT